MAKSKSYNDQRSVLAQMLKEEPIPTPLQEVRPVATKPIEEELARINGFWVPADLARRLKVHAASTGTTIREIAIEALETYLRK